MSALRFPNFSGVTAVSARVRAKDLGRKSSETVFPQHQRRRPTRPRHHRRPTRGHASDRAEREPHPCGRGGKPSRRANDTSTRLHHRIFFADSKTPERAAKRAGAKFCEIREQIGGTAPIDPETMTPLAMESRARQRNDFQPADLGKTVYYALRWVNTTGEPGPLEPNL